MMGPLHPRFASARTESKAIMSLAFGLLSVTPLGVIAGLPAIVLGALARRDIDRSRGTLSGSAMAAGGIVSGMFGTGLGFVMLLMVVSSTVDRPDAHARRAQASRSRTPAATVTLPPQGAARSR